jgi:uncharacterized protein
LRYIFEWDPRKAKENLRNHRISFERAATIFRDPQARSIFDVAHSHEEDRWITLGLDQSGSLVVVCIHFTRLTRLHAGYASSLPGERLCVKSDNIGRDTREARI